MTQHRAGRLEEAAACYRRVLEWSPGYVAAWTNLGAILRQQDRLEAAVACYRRGLEHEPDSAGLLTNLGNVLKDLGRFEESISSHRRSAATCPNDTNVRYNLAVAMRESGDLSGALAELDGVCRAEPEFARAQFDRSLVLLLLGRLEEGWPAYEWRWKLGELKNRVTSETPRWHGESFRGKTLLIVPEQGFGDAILTSRFVPQVKERGGTVLLECRPELRRLFSALEGVDLVVKPGRPTEEVDFVCPMMSLPGIFDLRLDSVPPPARLHVPPDSRVKVQALLERGRDRFKLGIVWSGSATFAGRRNRATSLEHFLRLAGVPGVELYNLQKGPLERELRETGADTVMIDIGSRVSDFADTAAVVEQLDLVIMTDSAVAHLAGSLGKPVWNLLSTVPYFLYLLEGEDTPWYPSMRLFRQTRVGDWGPVFERVEKELAQAVAARRAGRWPT